MNLCRSKLTDTHEDRHPGKSNHLLTLRRSTGRLSNFGAILLGPGFHQSGCVDAELRAVQQSNPERHGWHCLIETDDIPFPTTVNTGRTFALSIHAFLTSPTAMGSTVDGQSLFVRHALTRRPARFPPVPPSTNEPTV